jgi:antitoxin CptB
MHKECLPKNLLFWRCRRSILELDSILIPFFNNHYDQLDTAEKESFSLLLSQEDPELQGIFFLNHSCKVKSLESIVKKIKTNI